MELLQVEIYRANGSQWTCDKKKLAVHSDDNKGSKKERIKCHLVVPFIGLFIGRVDGKIYVWESDMNEMITKHKDTVLLGHSGTIHCLKYMKNDIDEDHGILISGSSDRTMKLWNNQNTTREYSCIQTLTGHDGTITDINIMGPNIIISSSIDKTFRIWEADKDRNTILSPWYKTIQVITIGESWVTTIDSYLGDISRIFIGDSSGNILCYNSTSIDKINRSEEKLKKNNGGNNEKLNEYFHLKNKVSFVHHLGITQILHLIEQNKLITLGFDNRFCILDSCSGTLYYTIENPKRCRFICFCWDFIHHDIILGDEEGTILVWSMMEDKFAKIKIIHKTSITSISCHSRSEMLFIASEEGLYKYKIERDLTFIELSGHQQPVVSVVVTKNDKMEESSDSTFDNGQDTFEECFFSASLDNTIRCWDSHGRKVRYGFRETKSEISCMIYYNNKKIQKLITGNNDGSIRFWNPDSGGNVSVHHHKNTITSLFVGHVSKEDYLFSSDSGGLVCIWDLEAKKLLLQTPPPLHRFFSCIHPENNKINKNNSIDTQMIRKITSITFKESYLGKAKEEGIFCGFDNGDIQVWNFYDFRLHCTLKNKESVTKLVIDGIFLFSGHDVGYIKIWNMVEMKNIYIINILEDPKTVEKYSMDIECYNQDLCIIQKYGYLVTCGLNGYLYVWDYVNQKVVHKFSHQEKLKSLAYRSKEHDIICGTEDNNIIIFKLPTKEK